MDGKQMIKQYSLQRDLNKWVLLTALAFILIGAVISGVLAFSHVRQLQDQTLIQISTLVTSGVLNDSSSEKHHELETETVIVNELGKKQHEPIVPMGISDGLHSIELDGKNWRILVITEEVTHRRFSVAQQTKHRDHVAINTVLSVFFPIALSTVMMLFIIKRIIGRQFRTLSTMAKVMDRQDGTNLEKLSINTLPIEISPFVQSINSLLARIEITIKKQQRFIADAAHELRTPLTALSLQVENLSEEKHSNDNQENLTQLKKGLKRLSKLVAQLLDLARLQNEDKHTLEKVSLNKLIEDAIADLHPLAEESDIDLGIKRHSENISVNDQQGRLSQLVYNAIDNAIHYTPKEGKVDISVYLENDKAIFLVEDTGIGIPEVELDQVIQPFYRVNESNLPGNGLGLAISHEIAQLLGGEIRLENRTNGGLRFKYTQKIIL
ncbi:MAG: two-component system OmpR family sensor kinase [Cocleimonas sp.]